MGALGPNKRTDLLLAILLLLRGPLADRPTVHGCRVTAGDTNTVDSPSQLKGIEPAEPRVRDILLIETRWWVPNSLAAISLATVIGIFWANLYYRAYFEAFGLNPVQAGVTRTDIILRLLPFGVAIGLVILLLRLAYVLIRYEPTSSKVDKIAKHKGKSKFAGVYPALALLGLLSAVILFTKISGEMTAAGHRDADHAMTVPFNVLYDSALEQYFDTTALVAEIEWVGPAEANIFVGHPTLEDKKQGTLARILAQTGETTVYFDLVDCDVKLVPTIDLLIRHGPTEFTSKNLLDFKLKQLAEKPCKSMRQ
jgi:hypothetical protein